VKWSEAGLRSLRKAGLSRRSRTNVGLSRRSEAKAEAQPMAARPQRYLNFSFCPARFGLSKYRLGHSPFVSQKHKIVQQTHFVFLRNTPPFPNCAILAA
jgi:hypothetical protein